MTTPITNYEILTGQDLGQIFKVRLVTDPSNSITGFEYYDTNTSTYKDLSNLFYPYVSGTISDTNYVSKLAPYNGKDLNLIFQSINIIPEVIIWPYINYNNKNTRQSIYNGPPATPNPPTTKWLYQAPAGKSFNDNSLVIGPTGIIYIAEDNGYIYALIDNGSSASILFSSNTTYTGLLPPTIGANNIMYIAATNTVRAYKDINTATPSILWSLSITSPPATNPKSPIIGLDGSLYVSTSNGYIYSISNNGSLNWSYYVGYSLSSLAIGSNGTIYGCGSTYLYALNNNGTLKWSYNVGVALGVPSIGADGTIYAINLSSVYAITDTVISGTSKWILNIGTTLGGIVSIGNNNRLYLVTDTTVISVTDSGSSGTINWTCNTLPVASQALTSVSIGLNGTIYITGDYGLAVSIKDNGSSYTINWAFQVISGGLVGFSSPCSIGYYSNSSNGRIYFGGDHNYIIAL